MVAISQCWAKGIDLDVHIILCRNLFCIVHVQRGIEVYRGGRATTRPSYTCPGCQAAMLYVDCSVCRLLSGGFKVVRIHNYVRGYRSWICCTMLGYYY